MRIEKFIQKTNSSSLCGIAHRGLYNDKFCENSILAFENAIKHEVAFELDVHLTKDNVLVVCHDSNLKRTTNKDGIIEELTLEEIKKNYTLTDGSKVPTLQEVLILNREQVPMVIELKTHNKNNKELAAALIKELDGKIVDKSNYQIIAFDPRALFPLKDLGILRILLVAEERYDVFFFRHFFEGVDIEDKLLAKKKVRRYIKNHFTNIWTINSIEKANNVTKYVDTMTFEHVDPKKIREIILSSCKIEHSFGAVLYKLVDGKILYLLEYMRQGHISLCKGHPEDNEDIVDTVKREAKEETGCDIEIDTSFKHTISYFPKAKVYKDVTFFVGKITSDNKLVDKHDNEVKKIELLPFEEAIKKLTYRNDIDTLIKANKYLNK